MCTQFQICSIVYQFKVEIYCNSQSTRIAVPPSLETDTQTFYIDKTTTPYFEAATFISRQPACQIISYAVFKSKNEVYPGWTVENKIPIKFVIPEGLLLEEATYKFMIKITAEGGY